MMQSGDGLFGTVVTGIKGIVAVPLVKASPRSAQAPDLPLPAGQGR